MSVDRVEMLRQIISQDPGHTLARYGLAMEYANASQYEQAVAEFEALLAVKPDYAYAYYHAGQALERLGRHDDARAMYRRGLENTADAHARSELQTALDLLG